MAWSLASGITLVARKHTPMVPFGTFLTGVLSSMLRCLIMMPFVNQPGAMLWLRSSRLSLRQIRGLWFLVHLAKMLLAASGFLKPSIVRMVLLRSTRLVSLLVASPSCMVLIMMTP
jgi:hypothetical protein